MRNRSGKATVGYPTGRRDALAHGGNNLADIHVIMLSDQEWVMIWKETSPSFLDLI
jgi:hypothetical protein